MTPRHGFLLGKFMPLTLGHCHLIDGALARCERLTVMVCSVRREPIDGHLRYRWVREVYGARASVLHVTVEVPSYPHEHPDFWAIWRDLIRRHVPAPIDVVFTSEDYGDRLAAEVGAAAHVCIDRDRSAVPVSATRVREDPLGCWEYLPECVRPYYAKRILVTGPESTGKTTLARQLAEHYATSWVPEQARDYADGVAELTYDDLSAIAVRQLEAEEEAARRANRLVFCDTDLVTTEIYAREYFGRCPRFVERLADERRYDLALLCDIELPWQPDPHRTLGDRRREFFDRFRAELDSRRAPYALVRGAGDARLARAVASVDTALRAWSGNSA